MRKIFLQTVRNSSKYFPLFINPFHKTSDTIIVAGAGRSGTTWLSHIIGQSAGFLLLFEPFDYRKVPNFKSPYLRLYIRPHEKSHVLDKAINDALDGQLRNKWILSHNPRMFTWRILLKEIRANLFIGYIKNRFSNRIIYIIRHPCASVLSRMKLKWETHVNDLSCQSELMEDYLGPHESLINDAESDLEKHTVMWCIENLIPLKQLSNENFIFCAYENLVVDTRKEISRIFQYLNLAMPSMNRKPVTTHLGTYNKGQLSLNDVTRLTHWKTELSKSEIKSIITIVHRFGIDLYNEDVMPNFESIFLK